MAPRLAILLSGSGTTYDNIATQVASGQLRADIVVVIASRADVGGVALAAAHGHHCVIASQPEDVTAALAAVAAEWVLMCGWLRYYDPPPAYRGKCLNVHPSLLPSFGGSGMYGMRVHRRVHAAGVKVTGCTVHLVAGDYDSGPILAQQAVAILPTDNPADIAARVQAAERECYPRVIAAILAAGIKQEGDRAWCPALATTTTAAPQGDEHGHLE